MVKFIGRIRYRKSFFGQLILQGEFLCSRYNNDICHFESFYIWYDLTPEDLEKYSSEFHCQWNSNTNTTEPINLEKQHKKERNA